MDDSRRSRPYIWVTWLTGLLAGGEVCEWKAWYKAHFRYAKREREDGNLDQWKIDHDGMVRRRVTQLQKDGWTVTTEYSNKFKLEGVNGDLAGQPDIVAVKKTVTPQPQPNEFETVTAIAGLVVDEKSGQKKVSDVWQVLIYLWALPRLAFKSIPLTGEVEYRSSVTEVSSAMLDVKVRAKLQTLLQVVSGDLEPPRSPSSQECQFCDVDACPDRIESVEQVGDARDTF